MLRRARIEKVIHNDHSTKFMTVLVTWLDMEGGFYDSVSRTGKIDLSYSYISRSFGIQYYPLPGDIVLCGFLIDQQPIVISFLVSKYYEKVINNNAYGYYFRNIVQGELAIKALQGNELYFDRKGSLRFIVRDQEQLTEDLREVSKKDVINEKFVNNYLPILNDSNDVDSGRTVDLTKQVKDVIKTEVTIGKVYDEEYKEEQKFNNKSIALQVVGKDNEEKEVFSLKINEEGEISLGRADGKYQIMIDKEGNISLIGTKIHLDAKNIILDSEPGVKGTTLLNWCNTHTHYNGNEGSPTGIAIKALPQSALTQQ